MKIRGEEKKQIIEEVESPSRFKVPLQELKGAQRFYLHLMDAAGQETLSPYYNAVLSIRNVVQRTLERIDSSKTI